jgi:hypothetical protein
MSKAYDMVDWGFLRKVIQRMGFAHRWVDRIMECVTKVKYMVKFNGSLLDSFPPSRGWSLWIHFTSITRPLPPIGNLREVSFEVDTSRPNMATR